MPGSSSQFPNTCVRCLRARQLQHPFSIASRPCSRAFSHLPRRGATNSATVEQKGIATIISQNGQTRVVAPPDLAVTSEIDKAENGENVVHTRDTTSNPFGHDGGKEQGAMSRRLSDATEEALYTGGRAGRKAVEEAGFSEELKDRLLEKVKAAQFRAENADAFAEIEMPSIIGRGSRDLAQARPWSGTEAEDDTVLRMLDDARKPLRTGLRGTGMAKALDGNLVDLRLKPKARLGKGQRLANARDKTSIYALSKETNMSEKEREEMRKVLKDKFTPGAGAMPTSFRGLAALANERIEDAIARGQFKNIPRGKDVVRDVRADNPFIDTTEYIMNKMIKRQEIVPPWIEKQQELVKAASIFRARLRNDWKRHAARTIASRGGTLQEQMRTADRYAEAERVYNPKKRSVESISVPTSMTEDPVMVNIIQEAPKTSIAEKETRISMETRDSGGDATEIAAVVEVQPTAPEVVVEPVGAMAATPLPALFRIPSWEKTEMSYLMLAISDLNSKTRSYNLMAPDLAKKPYFSLERELNSCYADIAPQLAETIKERAARPAKQFVEKIGHRPGGVMERFGMENKVKVYDNQKPLYGLKEFWNDLFRKE